MASKALRRARRRAITLAGGGTAQQPPTGRDRRHINQQDDTPPPILAARAQRCPLMPGSILHESDMGRCIMALAQGDELADLTDAWGSLSASRRNYQTLIIGTTGSPQGSGFEFIPDRMETDPSLRVDLRTHDERIADAEKSWASWKARINALPAPQMIWVIRGALDGFIGDGSLWRDGKPTASGGVAVAALKRMV